MVLERFKLQAAGLPTFLATVWGMHFRWRTGDGAKTARPLRALRALRSQPCRYPCRGLSRSDY